MPVKLKYGLAFLDSRYVNVTDHTKAAHDALGLSHDSLADVSTSDHHVKYTDAAAVAAVLADDAYLKNIGDISTGNLEISKADPELRLTDTGDSEYTRITRADTSGKAVRYNRAYEPGITLNTIDFDGSDDYVALGKLDDNSLDLATLTWEAWIRPTGAQTSGSSAMAIMDARRVRLGIGSINADLEADRGKIYANWYNGAAVIELKSTSQVLCTAAWHHIAFTFDDTGNVQKLYFDGVEVDSDTQSASIAWVNDDFNIGARYNLGAAFWDGIMTEIRVWNRALHADDITIHANIPDDISSSNTADCTYALNCLAHYECNTGSGETLVDSSAAGNDGTFYEVGGPAWLADQEIIAGADVEVLIWSSEDGVATAEEGIQTFGDPDGRTVIQGVTQRFFIGASEKVRIDASGNVGIGLTPTANMLGLSVEAGLLTIKETTPPTADTNYGKLWTNTSDELWFQDGAGANHLLHGDAFSHIWFHSPNTVEVTISAQDTFTKIDSFTVVGNEDDALNVVGSASTNDLTLSASGGGEYEISYHGSVTATGGADKDMMVAFGIILATPKDITDVTDDTISPIVITSTAHGLKEGDMVEIVGVLGNDAANGSFIVDNETANTFEIVALDGTATTGDGDFDAGSPTGDVTIVYPGNMVVHRTVRGADPGAISATGLHILANSDVLALYVANLVGTTNLTVLAVSLDAVRIGD